MEPEARTDQLRYVIPARTISGSAQDILDELDDMVDALQLVRQAVIARVSARTQRPRAGWPVRVWRRLGDVWRHRRP